MQRFRTIHLLLWFFLLPLLAQPVLGADSTSFDPTKVAVEAKSSGGVPVGTIISWPVATNPEDMDNWLECNGQSISPSVYPELFALVGPNVPDLRGLFLRGYGSQSYAQNNGSMVGVTATLHSSGQLGQVQGDATRQIYGQVTNVGAVSGHSSSGAMYSKTQFGYANDYNGSKDDPGIILQIDSERITPTAAENRPVNQAVRYLMRARR